MTPKEKALKICQAIGVTTLFDKECHGGRTLPLHVSQKIAHIMVNELIAEANHLTSTVGRNQLTNYEYWQAVKKEIDLL